jgi:hypothetical protein
MWPNETARMIKKVAVCVAALAGDVDAAEVWAAVSDTGSFRKPGRTRPHTTARKSRLPEIADTTDPEPTQSERHS